MRGSLDEIGDLTRMELRQLAGAHPQPRAGNVAHERLDARPVENSPCRCTSPEPSRQEPSQRAAQADIDAHDAPGALDEGQLDVARARQSRPGYVDEAVPEDVLAQENFPRPALEATEIELISRKLHATGLELADHLGRDEELASGNARLETRHRGIGAVRNSDDQVLDTAEAVAASVYELALDEHREM